MGALTVTVVVTCGGQLFLSSTALQGIISVVVSAQETEADRMRQRE